MHSDLVCQNDGEERVLFDFVYRKIDGYKNAGGKTFKKEQLGFFILNPPNVKSADGYTSNIAVYQLVITPKPGLFPVK